MRSATTSGVPPEREIRWVVSRSSGGIWPPCSWTNSTTDSVAPLRMRRPSRSTPLMRVWAVKGMKWLRAPRLRVRDSRTFPWRGLRWNGLRGFRRRGSKAGRRRPVRFPWHRLTGMNSTAWRLPRVMVPVLSSSRVLTSPAASTALPLMARTLCCMTRSMPAMPMAESRPPMVVGMRQTSSEIRTVTLGAWPAPADCTLYWAKG